VHPIGYAKGSDYLAGAVANSWGCLALLEMKIPHGADIYAAIMVIGAMIIVWDVLVFVLEKALMFY
jgi:hypothetical protein